MSRRLRNGLTLVIKFFIILFYGSLGFTIISFISLSFYESITTDSSWDEFTKITGLALAMAINCGLSALIILIPSLFLKALPGHFKTLMYAPTFLIIGTVWFSILQAQIGAKEVWWFANLGLFASILYFIFFLRWADGYLKRGQE